MTDGILAEYFDNFIGHEILSKEDGSACCKDRPFYKVKGAVFYGSSQFASHNTSVATR